MKLFIITLAILPLFAFGQKKESLLNKLFAPGPLIEGHKDLEKIDCLKCHDAGEGVPDSKCLDCHKEIDKTLDNKKSFHGSQTKNCFQCHTDHKERDYDSTEINLKTFDHDLTGYKLEGKHSDIKCAKCHKEKRTKKHLRKNDLRFLGVTSSCKECHKKEDIHYFKDEYKKKDCGSCHGLAKWNKDITFNHDKDTDYILKGEHEKLKCNECHITNKVKKLSKYKWHNLKKTSCLSCHKDTHKKNLSKKFRNGRCDDCHNNNTWKIKKFDHKVTKYELKGTHAKSKCIDCHKQPKRVLKQKTKKHYKWAGLTTKCLSCHKDTHKYYPRLSKKLGDLNKCENCHNENKWKEIHDFDHYKDTKYPITGKHKKLNCNKCHTPIRKHRKIKNFKYRKYHWKRLNSKTCATCHKTPHKRKGKASRQFFTKKCDQCHTTEGWLKKPRTGKNFDHRKTRFKLTGDHKKLTCKKCHNSGQHRIYKFKSFKKQFCVDCHKTPHKYQFSDRQNNQSCAECHNTSDFKNLKRFDHNDTAFKLKSTHKKLKCVECHKRTKAFRTRAKKKPKKWHKYVFEELEDDSCTTCHSDFHKGQFKKTSCKKCHTEKTWYRTKFQHNRDSDYKLLGKHKKLKCYKCHKKAQKKMAKVIRNKKPKWRTVRHYTPIDSTCINCHKKDDKHKGDFGINCAQCHREKSWKYSKDFHKNFTLHGAHYTAECSECHNDNGKKLSGTSENCIYCHQKDDVHSGSLPNCNDCHRQQFWEHTRFRHSMTFFPLRGAHRTLDCFQCHNSNSGNVNNNQYEGTPADCSQCHATDRASVSGVAQPRDHTGATFDDCSQCHNQFSFDLGL